jgi:hypothetical protein
MLSQYKRPCRPAMQANTRQHGRLSKKAWRLPPQAFVLLQTPCASPQATLWHRRLLGCSPLHRACGCGGWRLPCRAPAAQAARLLQLLLQLLCRLSVHHLDHWPPRSCDPGQRHSHCQHRCCTCRLNTPYHWSGILYMVSAAIQQAEPLEKRGPFCSTTMITFAAASALPAQPYLQACQPTAPAVWRRLQLGGWSQPPHMPAAQPRAPRTAPTRGSGSSPDAHPDGRSARTGSTRPPQALQEWSSDVMPSVCCKHKHKLRSRPLSVQPREH